MKFGIIILMMLSAAQADVNTGSCKDMLQGYLTGQLSSALGAYQVEALRREFKSFTDVMEKSMKLFKNKINSEMRAMKDTRNGSIVYTRWGKRTCPSNAQMVFSGYTGGSFYTHKGAAVEPLCLPKNPEWEIYQDGVQGARNYVFGAEYETSTVSGYWSTLYEHDVPCAVCMVVKRSVVKMFPARKTCFKGWLLEYHGYLMAGYHGHDAGTKYTCVDSLPDTLHGGQADKNGYLFYPVEFVSNLRRQAAME